MSQPIRKMFTEVPQTYRLLNHLLTLGQDTIWRRRAARIAASGGGTRWLDACGGTGEMAVCLSHLAADSTSIIVADFSLPMISKAIEKPEGKRIAFTLADVSRLPFRDNSFDAITISFATRNLNIRQDNLLKCLREFHRVLKPSGRFVNLETSQLRFAPIRWMFHLYVKATVSPIGRLVSGSDTAYTYLSHSMRHFYSPENLAEIIRQAGFCDVSFNRMLFGAAAIHKAIKREGSWQGVEIKN
ncbi:MAG: ubiquinone/menaquinone biosynthesis methyltransferase [Deltaproteobacteria bacterium]|nr:ubiquinone/menaquinone biosynthesis methyltransferase [Deltaproteobacteria bacterium]